MVVLGLDSMLVLGGLELFGSTDGINGMTGGTGVNGVIGSPLTSLSPLLRGGGVLTGGAREGEFLGAGVGARLVAATGGGGSGGSDGGCALGDGGGGGGCAFGDGGGGDGVGGFWCQCGGGSSSQPKSIHGNSWIMSLIGY